VRHYRRSQKQTSPGAHRPRKFKKTNSQKASNGWPSASARDAGKVRGDRKAEKPVYQEEGGPAPRIKRATAARRGRKARF